MTYGPKLLGYVVTCVRQPMDVKAPSCNHCCGRKAIRTRITYSEFVTLALGIRHGKRMRRNVICGLSGFTLFCRISHTRHDFRKNVAEHKMRVLILCTTFV